MDSILCWKFAKVDPMRAAIIDDLRNAAETRVVDLPRAGFGGEERFCFTGSVSYSLGRAGPADGPISRAVPGLAGSLLPLVERIDAALVPEMLWRDVASRSPYGNPRSIEANAPIGLITRLAWYDRDVATTLFEPTRALMKHTDPGELANRSYEFLRGRRSTPAPPLRGSS